MLSNKGNMRVGSDQKIVYQSVSWLLCKILSSKGWTLLPKICGLSDNGRQTLDVAMKSMIDSLKILKLMHAHSFPVADKAPFYMTSKVADMKLQHEFLESH